MEARCEREEQRAAAAQTNRRAALEDAGAMRAEGRWRGARGGGAAA
jgi:hypothetical protein